MAAEAGSGVCVDKIVKRTGVHIMPRAIPCTSSCDLHQGGGSLGAFGPVRVRARKLRGLDGLCFLRW